MSEPFLKPLSRLFAELEIIEDPAKKERAILFCAEKMIDFAILHDVRPKEEETEH